MHQNEEWMEQQIEDGLRQEEIAKKANISIPTVSRWIDRHGLKNRYQEIHYQKRQVSEDGLRRLFIRERMTYDELAEHFGVSKNTISDVLDEYEISEANRPARFKTDTDGYEVFRDAERYVAHHRLLMVAITGLFDISDYHVHHSNGVKWDNRPENLELIDPSSHMEMASQKGSDPP